MIPFARIATLIPSLGRENCHEVVAAARAIGAALRGAGADWHDFAEACSSMAAVGDVQTSPMCPPAGSSGRASFGDIARACRDLDRDRLSPKERGFVVDMVRRGFSFRPSPRQARWLADIHERLKERAAA